MPSIISPLAAQKKKSSIIVVVVVIAAAIFAGLGSWAFFRSRAPITPPQSMPYEKVFSAMLAEEKAKLPDIVLTRRFVLGESPMVVTAERVSPGKLFPEANEYWIAFTTKTSEQDLLQEYNEFLGRTRWKPAPPLIGLPAEENPTIIMERPHENIAITLAKKDGRTLVKVLYATSAMMQKGLVDTSTQP